MLRAPVLTTVLLAVLATAACSAGPPAPTPTPQPTSTVVPSVPADGIGLSALGVRNGPVAFSLPRSSVLATVVDQPNSVVLVLSAPAPEVVSGYLLRSLPPAGFTVSSAEETFTFAGHGWSGSYTSSSGSPVILLRPA